MWQILVKLLKIKGQKVSVVKIISQHRHLLKWMDTLPEQVMIEFYLMDGT